MNAEKIAPERIAMKTTRVSPPQKTIADEMREEAVIMQLALLTDYTICGQEMVALVEKHLRWAGEVDRLLGQSRQRAPETASHFG